MRERSSDQRVYVHLELRDLDDQTLIDRRTSLVYRERFALVNLDIEPTAIVPVVAIAFGPHRRANRERFWINSQIL